MSLLPQSTFLGKLKIYEVYDFYDGPKLFSVLNTVGTIYLVFWADQDSTKNYWLYTPVSKKRLHEIKHGKISVREAFIKPEDGILFEISINLETSEAVLNFSSLKKVNKEWFPIETDYFFKHNY